MLNGDEGLHRMSYPPAPGEFGPSELHIHADPRVYGWLLRAMFGPAPLPPVSDDVARWLDDGGPAVADDYGYDHVIVGSQPTIR